MKSQLGAKVAPSKQAGSAEARAGTSPADKDFGQVFTALRGLLTPYEGRLVARTPTPHYYYLESHGPTNKGKPMFFAAVRSGRNYVSFHLMPVYGCPEMLKGMSVQLKKRMQGKACFNFNAVDRELFKELGGLTQTGFQKFKSLKYFD